MRRGRWLQVQGKGLQAESHADVWLINTNAGRHVVVAEMSSTHSEVQMLEEEVTASN